MVFFSTGMCSTMQILRPPTDLHTDIHVLCTAAVLLCVYTSMVCIPVMAVKVRFEVGDGGNPWGYILSGLCVNILGSSPLSWCVFV